MFALPAVPTAVQLGCTWSNFTDALSGVVQYRWAILGRPAAHWVGTPHGVTEPTVVSNWTATDQAIGNTTVDASALPVSYTHLTLPTICSV